MSFFSMGKTIYKNLFTKPETVSLADLGKLGRERTRGHVTIEVDACIFCGICAKKCPTHAIAVKRPEAEWSIERFNCIQCSSCVDSCPKKCLHMDRAQTAPSVDKTIDLVKGEIKPKVAPVAADKKVDLAKGETEPKATAQNA